MTYIHHCPLNHCAHRRTRQGFFNTLTVAVTLSCSGNGIFSLILSHSEVHEATIPVPLSYAAFIYRPLAVCIGLWLACAVVKPLDSVLRDGTNCLPRLPEPLLGFVSDLPNPHTIMSSWSVGKSYGLFARMTTFRNELIFEGTADGTAWVECVCFFF